MSRVTRLISVAAFTAILVPAMGSFTAGASPIDDQRQKVTQIADELERLVEKSDILAEDYVVALDTKNKLDGEVKKAEKRVAAKEAEVAALREELAAVAVRAFTGAGANGLGPMFHDSSALTDDLQRDQLSRVALEVGTATTDELDEVVADLGDEREALQDKRAEAAEVAEQVEAAKQATEEKTAEYEQLRQQAEAELGEMLREEEERRARESYERMLREAEEAQRRAAEEARRQQQEQEQQQQQQEQQQDAPEAPEAPAAPDQSPDDGGDEPDEPRSTPSPEPEPEPSNPVVPPSSSRAGTAINAAKTQIGVPWIFAMARPGVGFDCSGLTSWSWGQAGVYLPHQSRAQFASTPHVPSGSASPGDLVFYYSPISHVGIYLGGGQLIHSPNSGSSVHITSVNWGKVTGVGRPG
jgi:cell wall-associated NlpC family hydrolase